jgi:hypothetical protein
LYFLLTVKGRERDEAIENAKNILRGFRTRDLKHLEHLEATVDAAYANTREILNRRNESKNEGKKVKAQETHAAPARKVVDILLAVNLND